MGYRAQNNWDEDDRKTWRQLPWRDRYDWRLVANLAIVVASIVVGLLIRVFE